MEVTMRFNWVDDETGQDMVEYALLLGFIALAGAASIMGIGSDVNSIWSIVNNRLSNASN